MPDPADLTALPAEELLSRFSVHVGDRAAVLLRTGRVHWPAEAQALHAELLRRLALADRLRDCLARVHQAADAVIHPTYASEDELALTLREIEADARATLEG